MATTPPVPERKRNTSSVVTLWSGLSAALAGVLFLGGGASFLAWDYLQEGHRTPFGKWAGTAPEFLLHLSILVAMPLMFFVTLVALYLRLAEGERILGATGLVFAFCGSAWRVLSYFVDIHPLYLRFAERGWPPYVLDWIPYLLIGLTAIGVGLVRAQTPGRWIWLPLGGALSGWAFYVTDFFGTTVLLVMHIASGALFGMSWVVLGYLLWIEGRSNRPAAMGKG